MRTKLLILFSIIISYFIFSVGLVFAEETKLTLSDDTFISQNNPNFINGNEIFLSASARPLKNSLIFLKFNTSKIPQGSTINNATLLMESYSCAGEDTTPALELSYANDNWNEETARWTGRPSMGLSIGVVGSTPAVKSWTITKTVSNWFKTPATNYGLILSVQGGPYTCNFYSKERAVNSINLIVKYTPPVADNTKPIISEIETTNISINSATITWSTNENATSFVNYFTSNGIIIPSIKSEGKNESTKSHSVILKNLVSGKKYSYRVKSRDSSNNEAVSSYRNFTTKSFNFIPTINLKLSPIRIQNTPIPTSAIPTSVNEPSTLPTISDNETNIPTEVSKISPTITNSDTIKNNTVSNIPAKVIKTEKKKKNTIYIFLAVILLLAVLVVISFIKEKYSKNKKKVSL